jgi:O-antigen/teichoic acid export membrane protein
VAARLRRLRRPFAGGVGALLGNVAARCAALASTFAATLILARNGGAAVVGIYTLLHVLPALVGTLLSAGLPVAIPYFLAGPDRTNRRLPLTIVAIAVTGGVAGTALWIALVPLFGPRLFPDLSLPLVMLAGVAVLTRLITTTAKSSSQGTHDLHGANRVIFTEEFMFLPAYAVVRSLGLGDYAAVVAALLVADSATSTFAWTRLVRRGFFHAAERPSPSLSRRIASYGLRAQVGGIMTQLNLRLDFIILGVLAGPAVLGVYAIASKFAELVKIFGMALTYVLYPRFARSGLKQAIADARKLIPRAALVTASAAALLGIACGFVIPALYGSAFDGAVTPARIILLGLVLDGVAGVTTAFFYGVGRPGLNSFAMAAGLVATVALDVLLIPPFEAVGAAVASAVAYTLGTMFLLAFFWRTARPQGTSGWREQQLATPDAR